MASTIYITANWNTGALSQQTISRQYDNNRYTVQFVGYPESEDEALDYYLLVWMSSSPGQKPDEIAPILLNSDQWHISNVFTQQVQLIKFQMCVLNGDGTYEAHSPIFTGRIGSSLEHDGTTQDIDVSTLFDAYREYIDELIIRAGAVVIDNTLSQSGQAADAKKTGDEISALKEDLDTISDTLADTIGGGAVTLQPTDETYAEVYYTVNTNTGIVSKVTSSLYYYALENPIDISGLKVGTEVSCLASLMSSYGAFITDASYNALDYVTGNNASDKGYEVNTTPQTITFTVPENAKYLMADIRNTLYTGMSDFNVSGTADYNITDDAEENSGKLITSGGVYNALSTGVVTTYTKIGANLYDPSKGTAGYLDARGNISSNDSYTTTDFIPITANEPVAVNRFRKFLVYDTDKNPDENSFVNALTNNYVYTPTADGYIRVSLYNNYNSIVAYGSTVPNYQPYESQNTLQENIHLSDTMTEDVTEKSGNNLYGKKWVHCGDSFSHFTNAVFESGEYTNKYKTFPRIIAEKNGMTLEEDFFLSGRTMAYPSDGTFANSLTNPSATYYYQNIPTDADYVTIMLGINDVNHGTGDSEDGEDTTGTITIGTIDDTGTDTYYGAYNNVLGWLRENLPFAHVGVIITNGTRRQDYTEAQIALAKKWGYPYINLNGDERTPAMIRCYNTDMSSTLKSLLIEKQAVDYDGSVTGSVNLHPNYQAHAYEATFIEEWLRNI